MRLDSGNNEPCLFAEPLEFVEILAEDFEGHISRVPVMVSCIWADTPSRYHDRGIP
jgi:hypothetical protein